MAHDYGFEDLKELWDTAMDEYAKLTGNDLRNSSPQTIEDMALEIRNISKDRKDSRVIQASMSRLIELGDVVSEAVSDSFAPASVIFNAVKYAWEIGQTYQNFFRAKSVAQVLENLNPHLERFDAYRQSAKNGTRLQAPVVRSLSQILTNIIRICAFYAGLKKNETNPLRRTLNVIGAVVGDGKQVQDCLDEIEKLAKDEERFSIASIYGNTQYVKGDRVREQYEESIRLYFEELSPAVLASWDGAEKKIKRQFIPEVGSWLGNYDVFSSWADVRAIKTDPVLFLQGEEGSGKTHLAYRAIRRLKSNMESETKEQSAVACFYFKTTKKEEPVYTVRQCLLALIWQFAKTDPEYREFVANRCKDTGERLKETELWDRFITGHDAVTKRKKTFFVVLDGIDQAGGNGETEVFAHIIRESRRLTRRHKNFRVRVLFTSTNVSDLEQSLTRGFDMPNEAAEEKRKKLLSEDGADPCPTISPAVRDKKKDLECFVNVTLARQDIPPGDMLNRIKEKLVNNPCGNFREVLVFLDEIAGAAKTGRLQRMLDREFRDLSETLTFQIKRFNAVLDAAERETLNKIITYIVLMKEQVPTLWPTLHQLKVFLDWDQARDLEDEIRGKFSSLLKIIREDGVTRVKSEILRAYFQKTIDSGPDDTRPSHFLTEFSPIMTRRLQASNISIPEEELDDVRRRFMATYGSYEWSRLQMDGHFEQLRATQQGTNVSLGFKVASGHLQIIKCILRQVCNAETSWFNDYAAVGLPYHLDKVTNKQLSCEDGAIKIEIGYHLCQFFFDENAVMRWTEVKEATARRELIGFDDGWCSFVKRALRRWFQDLGVREGAMEYVKEIREPASDLKKVRDVSFRLLTNEELQVVVDSLLKASKRTMATQWLHCFQRDALQAYEMYAYAYYFKSYTGFIMNNSRDITEVAKTAFCECPTMVIEKAKDATPPEISEKTTAEGKDETSPGSSETLQDPQTTATKSDTECSSVCQCEDRAIFERYQRTRTVRIAQTFLGCDSYQEAEFKACKDVMGGASQEDDQLEAAICLAEAYLKPYTSMTRDCAISSFEIMNRSMRQHTNSPKGHVLNKSLLKCIWDLCISLKEKDTEMLDLCAYLLRLFPENVEVVDRTRDLLNRGGHALRLYRKLASERETYGPSALAILFRHCASSEDFHRKFYTASRSDPGFALESYSDARNATKGNPIQSAHIGNYYGLVLRAHDKLEEAIFIWKESVPYDAHKGSSSSVGHKLIGYDENHVGRRDPRAGKDELDKKRVWKQLLDCQHQTAHLLATAYVEMAKHAIPEEAVEYARKVDKLKKWIESYLMAADPGFASSLARVWTICWQAKIAEAEEKRKSNRQTKTAKAEAKEAKEKAREAVLPISEFARRILEDQESRNDWNGYLTLAHALIPLGDDDSVCALWSLLCPVDEEDNTHTVHHCAGKCEWKWPGWAKKGIYICRDCANVWFEEGCHAKLLSGSLDILVCHATHEFLYIPRWKRESGTLMDMELVEVGTQRKLQPIGKWLNHIFSQHGLSKSDIKLPRQRFGVNLRAPRLDFQVRFKWRKAMTVQPKQSNIGDSSQKEHGIPPAKEKSRESQSTLTDCKEEKDDKI